MSPTNRGKTKKNLKFEARATRDCWASNIKVESRTQVIYCKETHLNLLKNGGEHPPTQLVIERIGEQLPCGRAGSH